MSQNRYIPNARHFAELHLSTIIEQACHCEGLAFLQLDFRFGSTRRNRGYGETGNRKSVTEIQRTYLGHNVHPDYAVFSDEARKIESHAKRTKLNGYGYAIRSSALNNWEWKFSTCKKAGLLSIQRQQIGLRKNFQHRLVFQVLDSRAKVDVWSKQENVQQVCKCQTRCNRASRSAGGIRLKGWRRELLSRDATDCVCRAGAKEIHSKLLQFCAVNFSKLDFQQYLLLVYRSNGKGVDNAWRIQSRHLTHILRNL